MSSLHRRIASRLRFRDYLRRYRAGSRRDSDGPAEPAPAKHRSLARLYRELYRLLIGHRLTIALALAGALAGDALEVDSAGGDQGRDRLRRAGAAVARRRHGVESRFGPGITQGPPGGAGGPGPGRLGARQVLRAVEPLAGHAGDQASPGRGPAQGLRTRDAASACTGSTSSSRAGLRACCARMPAAWAS